MCKRDSHATFPDCPICFTKANKWLETQKTGQGASSPTPSFLDHIAECMHTFSLRALPWDANFGEYFGQSDQMRINRDFLEEDSGQSHGSLPESALSFRSLNSRSAEEIDEVAAYASIRNNAAIGSDRIQKAERICQAFLISTEAWQGDWQNERYEEKEEEQKAQGPQKVEYDQNSRDQRIITWLSPPDPSTNLKKALEQRHKDTGQWFLHTAAYSDWESKRNSFLWLYGIPGCGKTTLSSTIIQDLQENLACSPLYFYFDFDDTSKQSFEKAVRSLITQLYGQKKDVQEDVDSLYSSCEDGERQPSIDSLCKTFQHMVQEAGQVWIILDALDECQTRKGLLSWIESIRSSQRTNIHLLATSRPEQDIKSAIEMWAHKQDIVPIQSDLVKGDIRAYVHTRVREHEGLSRWQNQPDVQKLIEDTLTDKADGM